jgi:hypothetical protein
MVWWRVDWVSGEPLVVVQPVRVQDRGTPPRRFVSQERHRGASQMPWSIHDVE